MVNIEPVYGDRRADKPGACSNLAKTRQGLASTFRSLSVEQVRVGKLAMENRLLHLLVHLVKEVEFARTSPVGFNPADPFCLSGSLGQMDFEMRMFGLESTAQSIVSLVNKMLAVEGMQGPISSPEVEGARGQEVRQPDSAGGEAGDEGVEALQSRIVRLTGEIQFMEEYLTVWANTPLERAQAERAAVLEKLQEVGGARMVLSAVNSRINIPKVFGVIEQLLQAMMPTQSEQL